ncbi:MBOAT family protein [Marinicauda algicola]|uniref:Probable alginate O-acetylase AlgI n=1 Tax=Marinicauda algicola TaxID=2029849 RepID=A0A4S2GWS6_9PROT|nr:MBOAT family protein [Marinicauda algicola]TGY87555.1 MBOAT family protein [Marinicauda algicola]
MLFPTFTFAVFFVIVLFGAWALEFDNHRRKLFLLAASFVFYGWWDWRFCGLLFASALANWIIGQAIWRTPARPVQNLLVAIGVAANLAVLGFFKYYGFFLESAAQLLAALELQRDLPLMQVILPVGISFYTFQGISYVVDIRRGDVDRPHGLLDAMLYISFFPQLVAGPIVRARDFLPQLEQVPRISREMIALGALLIAWGLFKKTVIAAEIADRLVDPVFYAPSEYGPVDLLFGAYGYAVQIYCDFSAYSDIAIGVAALLGYRFARNFDQPYRAASFSGFWRRWHISLSTWLRDYLYIPLGGNRGGRIATYRNLMITMLLGGLWHGAAWTFVLWGALHGAALAVERAMGLADKARGLISLLVTFHVVCLGWILFRSPNFDIAGRYLAGFFATEIPVLALTPFTAGLVVFGLALNFLPPRGIERVAAGLARMPSPLAGLVIAFLLLVVEALRQSGIAPFIYFQF